MVLSDTVGWELMISWQWWRLWVTTWPSLTPSCVCVFIGAPCCNFVTRFSFLGYLAGVERLLSKRFVFLGCLFLVLWLERTGFCEVFCLFLLAFLGCQLLWLPIWEIQDKKKTQRTHHCFVPWVPKSPASLSSSLHVSESSYIHFKYSKSPTYERVPFREWVHKSYLFVSPTKLA